MDTKSPRLKRSTQAFEFTLQHDFESPLDEVIRKGKRLLDRGIIRELKDIAVDYGGFKLYTTFAVYGGRYGEERYVIPRTCSGSGFTRKKAKARAIGEGAERYCASVYDERHLVLDSYSNLEPDAVHPAKFALFSEKQYQTKGFSFKPFTEETKINWIWGYSLTRREAVLVPAAFVYLPYWPVGGEVSIDLPPSTGLACGNSVAEATLHGLYEVVERDAFMITWLNRIPAPKLNLRNREDVHLDGIPLSCLDSLGFEIAVHDITTDVGIPTRLVFLIDEVQQRPLIGTGAAARLQSEKALEKAIAEAFKIKSTVEKIIKTSPIHEFRLDYSDVKRPHDHKTLFTNPKMLSALRFLLDANQVEMDHPQHEQPIDGVVSELTRCLELLRKQSLEVIVVEITLPEVAEAGFSVVRVIIPGMIPLNIDHQYIYKGGRRLYIVPSTLGYTPQETKEKDLNPIPHPL